MARRITFHDPRWQRIAHHAALQTGRCAPPHRPVNLHPRKRIGYRGTCSASFLGSWWSRTCGWSFGRKLVAFLDSSQIAWFGGPMTPEEQLRKVSLRVTRPRVAVLTEVNAHPHANVDTLTAKVRARLGSVSTQACLL